MNLTRARIGIGDRGMPLSTTVVWMVNEGAGGERTNSIFLLGMSMDPGLVAGGVV